MNTLHKFVLNWLQSLDLKSSNKKVALEKWFIKNKELNIIAPAWNDEFELPDGSYSVTGIQDYIKFITKICKALSTNPLIHIYINRINNRFFSKINDGYNYKG